MATAKPRYNVTMNMVKCPYDSAHLVPQNRLPQHLLKCAKRKGGNFIMCPYNAMHQVERFYYEDHLLNCPDKKRVVSDAKDLKPSSTINLPPTSVPDHMQGEEFWDD